MLVISQIFSNLVFHARNRYIFGFLDRSGRLDSLVSFTGRLT